MMNVSCISTSTQSKFMTHRDSPCSKGGRKTQEQSSCDFTCVIKVPLLPLQRKMERHSLSSPNQESNHLTYRPSTPMTYPAWKLLYSNFILLQGSQPSRCGWMPSRMATSLLLTKHWRVTCHKHARMCAQPSPSQHQQHNHQPSFSTALFPNQPYPLISQIKCKQNYKHGTDLIFY